MIDLICLGSISMDMYFKGRSLTFGENRFQLAIGGKYTADFFYESIGGGAVNVAIGAKRHGLRAGVLGKIGNNCFKRVIHGKLEDENINHDLCQFEENYYNISTIILTDSGERSIIHFASSHQHLITDKSVLEKIKTVKAVYLGNLPDVSLTERIEILSYIKSNTQAKIFINLGTTDCRRPIEQIEKLIYKSDVVILNDHEFSELVKIPYKEIDFRSLNIVKFAFLKNKLTVITHGENGSYAYSGGSCFYQQAPKITKILDTTGAGDAYSAGFISEYLISNDIQKSMSSGSNYAVKILAKVGAN